MIPLPSSSGDAVADRRFAYAMDYLAAGETGPAAELVEQALEQAPAWTSGWLRLGELREALGDEAGALAAYRTAIGLDPADRAGAGPRLARLGARPADGAVSPAHMAALFDDYAPRFEAALVGGLSYRGPALLRAAIDRLGPRRARRAIDLGCGTGLAGVAFRDSAERLEGIDLSPAMLAIARRKAVYDALAEAEVVAALASEPAGAADLLIGADVVVYLGDLGRLCVEAARVLSPGGLFAFTAQRSPAGEPFALGADLRYAHSEAALRGWAATAGLDVAALDDASKRNEAGRPVPGFVVVLRR